MRSRGPSAPPHTLHMRSDPRLRSFQKDMRHRVLLRHCRDPPRHSRSRNKQWSPPQSTCPLDKHCMQLPCPDQHQQSREDTRCTPLRQPYSHDQLGTAHSLWTDQSPGRLDLPHSRGMLSTLAMNAVQTRRRHRVWLRQSPGLLHQQGMASTMWPTPLHNTQQSMSHIAWRRHCPCQPFQQSRSHTQRRRSRTVFRQSSLSKV